MSVSFYVTFTICMIVGICALWAMPIWMLLTLATFGLGTALYWILGWSMGEFENEQVP